MAVVVVTPFGPWILFGLLALVGVGACAYYAHRLARGSLWGWTPPAIAALVALAGLVFVVYVLNAQPSPRTALTEACLRLVEVPSEFSGTPHPESPAAIEAFADDPVCRVLIE